MSSEKTFDGDRSSSNGETATTTSEAAACGAAERDNQGRFAKGNPGGRGNPFARRVAAMRRALLDAVSEEDIAAISKKMVEQAREGDVAAARLVFTSIVGKPQMTEDPDRLDEKEWRQYVEETVREGELEAVIGGMSATLACTLAGSAVPAMQAQAGQMLLANLVALEESEKQEPVEEPPADPTAEEGPRTTTTAPVVAGATGEERAAADDAGGEVATEVWPGAPSVENAAAKVLAMLLGAGGKVSEPVRRAANGRNEGGNRPGPLAPPSSASPKGQGQPKSDG